MLNVQAILVLVLFCAGMSIWMLELIDVHCPGSPTKLVIVTSAWHITFGICYLVGGLVDGKSTEALVSIFDAKEAVVVAKASTGLHSHLIVLLAGIVQPTWGRLVAVAAFYGVVILFLSIGDGCWCNYDISIHDFDGKTINENHWQCK